jgi:hypothetical protein
VLPWWSAHQQLASLELPCEAFTPASTSCTCNDMLWTPSRDSMVCSFGVSLLGQ